MRKNVVNAYEFFVAKMGQPVTPAELIAGAELGTGGSGPGPIVWNLKTLLDLPIETKKDGKTVVSYTLPVPAGGKKKFVEPAMITEHYAKAAGATAPKQKKQKTAKAVEETIPATEVPEVATTEPVAETTAEVVDPKAAAKARKANRDKIRRAAQKAAKEAARIAAEAESIIPDFGTDVEGLEDFPEFLKRTPELAE